MNVVIVHDSISGNGKHLADILNGEFQAAGDSVLVGHVNEVEAASVAAAKPDLVVVGAAIRAFHTSPNSKRWLAGLGRALSSADTHIGHAAAFVTHALPVKAAEGWGRRFLRKLGRVKNIGEVYPEWFSGKVAGQNGPLEAGVEERFAQIAGILRSWTLGKSG